MIDLFWNKREFGRLLRMLLLAILVKMWLMIWIKELFAGVICNNFSVVATNIQITSYCLIYIDIVHNFKYLNYLQRTIYIASYTTNIDCA